jgi:hypothetical protein
VLPAGTRALGGSVAVSTVHLADGHWYAGTWRDDDGLRREYEGHLSAKGVDWSSYTPPEPAPKLCAACGAVAGKGIIYMDRAMRPLCNTCYSTRPSDDVFRDIARRSQLTATPGSGEAHCAACEQPTGYCAENCPTRPRDEPACSECKAPAALDPDCGMCAYCVTSTGHGDETPAAQDRIMRFSTDTHHGAEARKRLAAIERKERPRVTATSRMLAVGHPVCWPSNEGED